MSHVVDEFWDRSKLKTSASDPNKYSIGRIGDRNVVLVQPPGTGKVNAAIAAAHLRVNFPSLELVLVTGVCGGVPATPSGEEISLGDVVISNDIVQHDFGRRGSNGFEVKDSPHERLGTQPMRVRNFVTLFEANRPRERLEDRAAVILGDLQSRNKAYEPVAKERDNRSHRPVVFVGRVGSGDTIRSAAERDTVAKSHDIIAFEREGAGIWDAVPCIIVKGVCDDFDGRKSKVPQHFAAAAAAAVSRALIEKYPTTDRPK
ncbi:Nb-arc tpr domain-containing protein [Fusarium acuminatum]|jgi:nucleoside phosphorylase|uniref:Nb-arc tpr domain-containing protein n=1 Tax=Fusarium acuminatum TaxID=5515 RepID=A0ABZ2WVM9_9HYPO